VRAAGNRGRGLPSAVLAAALAAILGGCSIPAWVPAWVPYFGKGGGPMGPPEAGPPPRAPILARSVALGEQDEVVDRVICVVNNDAITQFDIAEAEAFHYFERKEEPPAEEARRQVRARILSRMIDSRLQLQQAQRDSITVEEAEMREGLAEIMKQLKVRDEAELATVLKAQGATIEQARKRIRDQLMVQKVVRRKVNLRVTVTEQEVDRYLQQNRDKLETGLTFEARHMLFLPEANGGPAAWDGARKRAEEIHALLAAGGDWAELAAKYSEDASAKDGGSLGNLKRGELAPDIERAILELTPGQYSTPFRSELGYHLFKLDAKETLTADRLVQARAQIREILFREKYDVRFRDWLDEIRARAIVDIRDASLESAMPSRSSGPSEQERPAG
jgi:peptidyl-prolyl cis-trans isomerase SurA